MVDVNPLEKVAGEASKRPERKFENRRLFWLVICIGVVLFFSFMILRSCANPLGGTENIMPAKTTPTVVVNGPLLGSAPSLVMPTTVSVPLGSSGRPGGGVDAWIVSDMQIAGKQYFAEGRVLLTGFTRARGGLVEIAGGGWVPLSTVRVAGDLSQIEKEYVESLPTPTKVVGPPVSVGGAPVVRVLTAVPLPTYTPYPTYTPSVLGGSLHLTVDQSGCVTLDISGVSAIYVDGRGVGGGTRVCNFHELRILK